LGFIILAVVGRRAIRRDQQWPLFGRPDEGDGVGDSCRTGALGNPQYSAALNGRHSGDFSTS
jgi:hypothetical protein